MRLCTPEAELSSVDVPFKIGKHDVRDCDYLLVSQDTKIETLLETSASEPLGGFKTVFWGDLNRINKSSHYDFFFSDADSIGDVKEKLREDFEASIENRAVADIDLIDFQIEKKTEVTRVLQKESDLNKEESVNIKGLGEYVIRLLGVNTIEQLVYETESLRILKQKRIKVSLIYVDGKDGFLCTRNTTRKIEGFGNFEEKTVVVGDRTKLANMLARPVLNHLKVYSEKLESGDCLYAFFESQEEFLEKDNFLMMLKKLLFTNFIRVLQSERLLKNSSLLSQAFQQIQNTSLLIGADYTVLFSNEKESLGKKCYNYMFGRHEPCEGCPIRNDEIGVDDSYGREVLLTEDEYVVHSSKVRNLNNNFYLHIYETEEDSKKRESIKIQRGKLQSLGLVTQALTHELNNPLTGILELSGEMSGDFEGQTLEDLNDISSAAKRSLDIIEGLKKFSSKKIEFSRVNLSEIVKSSLLLTKLLTRSISVYVDVDESLWVSGSSTLLSQLIFNIIKNSAEAMQNEGSVSISLKRESEGAVLIFEDTGPGLPKGMDEVSLFGTKGKDKGTGFGLFLVNEFVKLHKGRFSFGNLPESGAYFKIELPLT